MEHRRIGFVGLGQMGFPVVSRLLSAGVPVRLIDQNNQRITELQASYGELAQSGTSLSGLDVVILMLPNSRIVETVVREAAAAGELNAGMTLIDMGSSEPESTRTLAQEVAQLGVKYVDAPVSGGVTRAEAGTLAIMTGGADAHVAEVQGLLLNFGPPAIHVGPSGAGHAAKALNNLVSAASVSVTAEALHAARQFGIEPAVMNEVLNRSSGRSNTSETKVEQFMLSGTFGSGFALHLMAKDLRIAQGLLGEGSAVPSVAERAIEQWNAAAAITDHSTDHTAMYTVVEPQSGDQHDR